jgi:hypothetical protein
MRHLIHLKAKKSPSCLVTRHISRVNIVFNLIYKDTFFLFLIFDLRSIVAFVDILEKIFDSLKGGAYFYVDVRLESFQKVFVVGDHILIVYSFLVSWSLSSFILRVLILYYSCS